MIDREKVDAAAKILRPRLTTLKPRVAAVLGSGLGVLADDLEDAIHIPYGDLPGFPKAGVAGHAGAVVAGRFGDASVLLLQGRAHVYESGRADAMAVPIATLKAVGIEKIVLTNAAGSVNPDMPPGVLMAISDHVNLTGLSPLTGEMESDRFVDMSNAYDAELRGRMLAIAKELQHPLFEGVYVWFAGPQFETPAEIRMAQTLGGQAVGMSTVPETILARHAGMKVAAVSLITNFAAGLSSEILSHAHTLRNAALVEDIAKRLLRAFLQDIAPRA